MLCGRLAVDACCPSLTCGVCASSSTQGVLPGRYRTGRQQDVSEFKGFLFEALDAAWSARGGAASSVVQRLFGGRQATVRTCMTCQQSTWTMEACVDFNLPFRRRYTPVTDITAVVVPRHVPSSTPRPHLHACAMP